MGMEWLVMGTWGETDIGRTCCFVCGENKPDIGAVSPAFSHPSFPSLSFCAVQHESQQLPVSIMHLKSS